MTVSLSEPDLSERPAKLACERLEPNKLIVLTWLTALGTKGHETVVTIELIPNEGAR